MTVVIDVGPVAVVAVLGKLGGSGVLADVASPTALVSTGTLAQAAAIALLPQSPHSTLPRANGL